MIEALPKNTPVRGVAPAPAAIKDIAGQIAAYEQAGASAAAVQTDAEADAELQAIQAQTAALEAAVAAGQVQLTDPATVKPGALTGAQAGLGNFETAFVPAHAQTSVWGGNQQG
jgi:hypothetical protein